MKMLFVNSIQKYVKNCARCTIQVETKDLEGFAEYFSQDLNTSDNFDSLCKQCRNIVIAEHKERKRRSNKQHRTRQKNGFIVKISPGPKKGNDTEAAANQTYQSDPQ